MLGVFKRRSERGDTIIEVLFATAVFSMVAVGGWAVMSRGASTARRSLEVTLVGQQISAEADALRYIHHAHIASYDGPGGSASLASEWNKVRGAVPNHPVSNFAISGSSCPAITSRGFILNARTAKYHGQGAATINSMSSSIPDLPPYSQIVYEGDEGDDDLSQPPGTVIKSVNGIWIEAVASPPSGSSAGYIDFHIRACWNSPGGGPPSTLATIVRLYEPRV